MIMTPTRRYRCIAARSTQTSNTYRALWPRRSSSSTRTDFGSSGRVHTATCWASATAAARPEDAVVGGRVRGAPAVPGAEALLCLRPLEIPRAYDVVPAFLTPHTVGKRDLETVDRCTKISDNQLGDLALKRSNLDEDGKCTVRARAREMFKFDKIATMLRNLFENGSARRHRHVERGQLPTGPGHRWANFTDDTDHDGPRGSGPRDDGRRLCPGRRRVLVLVV